MSVLTPKVTLCIYRSFLIISLLGLALYPVHAFQQSAVKKTKYEFTDTRISEADTLLKNRKYEEALEAYQTAYNTYEQESFYEGMVYAKERMGQTYRLERDFQLAIESYASAIALGKRTLSYNHILIGKSYLGASLAYYATRDYVLASRYIDTAQNVYSQSIHYDSVIVKRLIDYKFYSYFFSGQSKDTMVKYLDERSRYFQVRGSTTSQEVYLLSDYARTYYGLGDFQKSIAYALEGVRMSKEKGDVRPNIYTDVVFNLARSLSSQKEYDRALSVTQDLIDYTEEFYPKSSGLPGYYSMKAIILNALHEYEQAVDVFLKVLSLIEGRNKSDSFYISTVMNLGVSYQLSGDYRNALIHLRNALNEEKKNKDQLELRLTERYKFLGQYYFALGEFDTATLYYDSALSNSISTYRDDILKTPEKGFPGTYRALDALKNKLLSLERGYSKMFQDSVALLRSTIEHVKLTHEYLVSNRDELQASQGKLFFSENFKSIYESGLNAVYSLYQSDNSKIEHIRTAFRFMNNSKSALFQEQSGELNSIQSSELSYSEKSRYYDIKQKIESLEGRFYSQFDEVLTNDSLRLINSDLMELNAQLDSFKIKSFSDINNESGQIKDEAHFEKVLDYLNENKNEGLVEYFVGDDYIFILGLSSKGTSFFRIENNEKLNDDLSQLLDVISQRPELNSYDKDLIDFKAKSYELYEKLLSPTLKIIGSGVNRVTIVPDEKLAQLPFEVLIDSKGDGTKYFYELNYLVRKLVVNYSFNSGELIQKLKGRQSNKNLYAVGFTGDGLSMNRSEYGALPGTEEEVKFLESRFEGDFFLGERGTKKIFLEEARNYDILHLAIHGDSDSTDRYQSKLIFNGEDGVLKTGDLYASDLKARLAILSACESGTGQINSGEGTFSIARGFAVVGVPSIVMSLWKVNDRAASDLMVSFHESLNNQLSVDDALSKTKLDYLENSDEYTSHPYYWSAFVSLGQPVTISNGSSKSYILLLGFLIIIFLGIIYFRKRKGA